MILANARKHPPYAVNVRLRSVILTSQAVSFSGGGRPDPSELGHDAEQNVMSAGTAGSLIRPTFLVS